jgi:acyl-CoA thioester hydrolase
MSESAPPNFRHHIRVPIRYADLDTLGHVNNASYLSYMEQARITYVRDMGLWDGYVSGLGLIVARICTDYKLALRLEDEAVDVWTRVSRLGNKSFTLEYVLNRSTDRTTAATSEIVMVAYDYGNEMTVVIPDDWRAKIVAYEPALPSAPASGDG